MGRIAEGSDLHIVSYFVYVLLCMDWHFCHCGQGSFLKISGCWGVKGISCFHRTWSFLTMVTEVHHWTLYWANGIESVPYNYDCTGILITTMETEFKMWGKIKMYVLGRGHIGSAYYQVAEFLCLWLCDTLPQQWEIIEHRTKNNLLLIDTE